MNQDPAQMEARIAELTRELESSPDPHLKESARQLVQLVLELHGAALARLLGLLQEPGGLDPARLRALTHDDLIASVLALHGLHPDPLPERARQALQRLQPRLAAQGVEAELHGFTPEGLAQIRVRRPGAESDPHLKAQLEEALLAAAPEIAGFALEWVAVLAPRPNFVPLASLLPQPVGEKPQRCDLCGQALTEPHPHYFERAPRRLLCVCDLCGLVLGNDTGRYSAVVSAIRWLPELKISPAQWQQLGSPVGLLFVYVDEEGVPWGEFPSPGGMVRAEIDAGIWRELAGENPELAALRPYVEAWVAHRTPGAEEYFLAPLDGCYRLAALIRQHWQGFSGGEQVQQEVAARLAEWRQVTPRAK